MIYLFQTTCYAALLFGIYLVFLRHRAAHALSRAWLLVCAMLPFIIPFIQIPGLQRTLATPAAITAVELPAITIWGGQPATGHATTFAWLPLAYAAICALLAGRIVAQYFWFARMARKHQPDVVNGVKVLHNTGMQPGSFGNYIFLPGPATEDVIVQHELAHIRLHHTADIMILRLLQAIFWPNVMLYVITHELRLVHEFQADILSAGDKSQYAATLLNSTFHTKHFSLSHTFFHHPLKRRIMMLQKSAPGRKGALAIAFKTCGTAAMLLTGIIWLQSCQQKSNQPAPSSTQNLTAEDTKAINALIKATLDTLGPGATASDVHAYKDKNGVLQVEINRKPTEAELGKMLAEPTPDQAVTTGEVEHTTDGRDIYKTVEKEPESSVDLMQYLSANLKYPKSAQDAKISGRVIVKFVVDEKGNVRDVTSVNKVDAALAAEAVRVVSGMPQWKPGEHNGKKVSVYFYLPVAFRLN